MARESPVVPTSGTIIAGGTSQAVVPANGNRTYFEFQNTSDTDMFLAHDTAATSTKYKIAPGAWYFLPNNVSLIGRWEVLCATTGKTYAFMEV